MKNARSYTLAVVLLVVALVVPAATNAAVNGTRSGTPIGAQQSSTSTEDPCHGLEPILPDNLEVGFSRTITVTKVSVEYPTTDISSGTDRPDEDDLAVGQYFTYTLLELPNAQHRSTLGTETDMYGDYEEDTRINYWDDWEAFFVYVDWDGWKDYWEDEKEELESEQASYSGEGTFQESLKIIDKDKVFGIKFTYEADYGVDTYSGTETYDEYYSEVYEILYDKETGSMVKFYVFEESTEPAGTYRFEVNFEDKSFDFGDYDDDNTGDTDDDNILGLPGLTWFIAFPALLGIVLVHRKHH